MIKSASVKARLKQLADRENRTFDSLLMYYFVERLLYRLSISDYADHFILKGGLLLYSILGNNARSTRDVDFLARHISSLPEEITSVFGSICAIEAEDAVRFDLSSLSAEPIRETSVYEGLRIKITAYLDKSRHVMQLDIGFGDIVIPEPVFMDYPSLLDNNSFRIHAYSRESVVAEKFEAMLSLAELNSRMKDFYDVYMLSRAYDFNGELLQEAVHQTLQRRKTPLPDSPTIFSDAFSQAKDKHIQWQAFQKHIRNADDLTLADVLGGIYIFLHPIYSAILAGSNMKMLWDCFDSSWKNKLFNP